MTPFRVKTLFYSALVAIVAWSAGAAADPAEYRLGPQDKLQIKVFDLRTGVGEAHEWTAFNGDFTIGAAGQLALPLLGEIKALNETTADLARNIAAGLQAKVGLAQQPFASVEVVKYRPFYIMGSVDKPGEYDYRPDLTVLQAVGTAGGMLRLANDSVLGYEREALVNRGDLRLLAADRIGLIARQARLDAEVKDAATIAFPAELTARASDPDVARTLREEQMLFDARRDALRSQTDALNQTKIILEREVESLNAKDASLARQLEVTKKELDQVAGLVAKGLAVLPRQLAVEQSSAQFESGRLDVQIAILRAQQDISKTARDILELQSKRRSDALTEAGEVHAKLVANTERIDSAQSLIFQTEVRAPLTLAAEADDKRAPVYSITRRVDGATQTHTVTESDLVQPGDIVRVELQRRPPGPGERELVGEASVAPPPGTGTKAASGF